MLSQLFANPKPLFIGHNDMWIYKVGCKICWWRCGLWSVDYYLGCFVCFAGAFKTDSKAWRFSENWFCRHTSALAAPPHPPSESVAPNWCAWKDSAPSSSYIAPNYSSIWIRCSNVFSNLLKPANWKYSRAGPTVGQSGISLWNSSSETISDLKKLHKIMP